MSKLLDLSKLEQAGATEVRKKFQEVIDKVHYTKEPIIISKHGKPWVMIKALEESNKKAKKVISQNNSINI